MLKILTRLKYKMVKISRKTKEMVLNAIEYFQREKESNSAMFPYTAVNDRVCAALGLSLSTVMRIKNENLQGPPTSPKKTRNCRKPVTDIDEFTKSAIRRTVYALYEDRKFFAISHLRDELKKREIFDGSSSSLLRVMHDLGFSWKMESNRRCLMESEHIAQARYLFLKKYVRNMRSENPLNIIFMDETWIFQKGSFRRSWQDNSSQSVRSPQGDGGRRYIVVHAGCKKGFVEGTSLVFASKTNTGDYHGDMNSENYIRWLQEQLLPALSEPSLIIIDNAPYHSTQLVKSPTSSAKKQELQDWLTNNNIPFDKTDLKQDLVALVKRHKPPKTYLVDKIINEAGHSVLRLPPYHCQFNAIEMIWSNTKTYYNKNIGKTGYSKDDVLKIWEEALQQVTPEVWANCVRHVEEIILEEWNREVRIDQEELAPFQISLEEDSSEDDA